MFLYISGENDGFFFNSAENTYKLGEIDKYLLDFARNLPIKLLRINNLNFAQMPL